MTETKKLLTLLRGACGCIGSSSVASRKQLQHEQKTSFRIRSCASNFTTIVALVTLACLCNLLRPAAYGQIVAASLQGQVQDPSGAPVQGAKVTALNVSTGISTKTATNSKGLFAFPNLTAGGPYTVTVIAPGFKTEERSGIYLTVNQHANINVVLPIGAVSQRVIVHADVNQLQTKSPQLGQVIGSHMIENLPLNARNVYQLMFLVPGTTGGVGYNYNGFDLSVNGGRPGSADILIDGVPAAPALVNPIAGISVFPPLPAVQEFRMQTSNYSAEFGRSGSGIVNIILKSGTNHFHGSAYEFLRNSALDANDYFANLHGQPRQNFKRSQFGASLGGPIDIPWLYNGRNKTFFFFAYEGLRQVTPTQITTTVPTKLEREGNFSQTVDSSGQQVVIYDPTTTTATGNGYVRQPFPNDTIPPQDIDPVAAKIINYFPLPNAPGNAAGQNNYFATGTSRLNIDTFSAKVNEHINDRNSFFVSYSHRHYLTPNSNLFPKADQVAEGGSTNLNADNSASIDYTLAATPTFVAEFRYGFSRIYLNVAPNSIGFNPSTQLGFPGYIAQNADHLLFPGINASGYVGLGEGGFGAATTASFTSHILALNMNKQAGSHLLQFGGDARLMLVNDDEAGQADGNYSFDRGITQGPDPNVATPNGGNGLASLLLGVGNGQMTIDSKNAATASKYFSLYFQDNWTVNDRLALNLGVRYDLDIPRTERYNRMNTFNPNIPSTQLAQESGLPGLKGGLVFVGVNTHPRRQFKPQWLNFSPRFGFAYKLNNLTVVRGGYGIFYGPSLRAAAGTVGNEGFSSTTTYEGSPNGLTPSVYLRNPFPNGLNPVSGSSQGLLTGIGSSFEAPETGDNAVPYTEDWNIDVQRQLPFDTLVSAAYVGSHGVHLNKSGENNWNANQLNQADLSLGSQLQQSVPNPFYGIIKTGPESGTTIARSYLEAPFPQFEAVYLSFLTGGYVDYNSFQMKLSKRLSHGLDALVSYTNQKQIDDYSNIINVGAGAGIQNIYNPKGERSISANNVSQELSASADYNLPFGRGHSIGAKWNWLENAALGGWQINGIFTADAGYPISVSTQNTSHANNNEERPNLTGANPGMSGSIKSRLNGYLNPAAFSQPAPFTFGNAPRVLSDVRTPAYHNIDFSIFKNFNLTRRLRAQFHAESYNILNQVVFGGPNSNFSSPSFGTISYQANSPRQIQFALKLLF
ncbi:MAG: TonB-dependent receptor domain-containing protein [Acidobacteriaceae bacterium]